MADKKSFTFNTFSNGLSNDPSKWKTHGAYSAGLDLIGIREIGTNMTGSTPNALQLSPGLYPDTVSAGSTAGEWHVKGLVEWVKRWDGQATGDLYAFIPANDGTSVSGTILRNIGGTGTWVSAHTTSAAVGGGGFGILSAAAFYGQDAYIGLITSAGSYINNFLQLTLGRQTPRPMKVFSGFLCCGNDRYISTITEAGAFQSQSLILPAGFVVRSLEVLGNYLVISADNGTFTRIFLWTGGTATYQEVYDLPEPTAPSLVAKEGRVFAIGRQLYQLGETSFQTISPYTYFGSAPTNNSYPSLGATTIWNNKILYGMDYNSQPTNFDGIGGVWIMGNYDSSYPSVNTLHFLAPVSAVSAYATTKVSIGGIYADNSSTLKVGYRDLNASAVSAEYGIASISPSHPVNSTYAYYLTLPITCDTNVQKLFHSIRLNMTGPVGNSNIAISIYYRTDVQQQDIYSSTRNNWTLLKILPTTLDSVTPNPQASLAIPIRKRANNIQFKFTFTSVTTQTPRLLDYTLVFEPLDSYR